MMMSVVRYFLWVERLPALAVHTKTKPVRNVAQIRASSIYHEPTFPNGHGALYLRDPSIGDSAIDFFAGRHEHYILSPPLPPQKSSSLLYIITLIITFITTLTILLSASHVHEIGILALQIDESIVMKLMMSSKECGVMMDIL
jgi:hypothetical protein